MKYYFNVFRILGSFMLSLTLIVVLAKDATTTMPLSNIGCVVWLLSCIFMGVEADEND